MAARRRRATEKLRKSGFRGRRLRVEALENRCLLSAEPVINEFLASNNGEIQDEDGDFSDFIELTNRGDQAVNLAGWYLTDDASDLNKWQFPSINLAPGQYLVVFASNKDRSVAGSQLHTNFALAAEGEYLALVQPDGDTVVSAFAPEFPPQYEDVSYGNSASSTDTTLIDLGDGRRCWSRPTEVWARLGSIRGLYRTLPGRPVRWVSDTTALRDRRLRPRFCRSISTIAITRATRSLDSARSLSTARRTFRRAP